MLRVLSAKKQHAFYESNLNSTQKVLFEADNKNGYMSGFTANYIKVKTEYDVSLINKVTLVTLSHFDIDGTMCCTLVEQNAKQSA